MNGRNVKHPAILSIVSSQTAFFPEGLPLIEPTTINLVTFLVVVGMNRCGKTVLKISCRSAREFRPN